METNVVNPSLLNRSTVMWGVFGVGIALSQRYVTHLLNKKKVVIVPAETDIKPYLPTTSKMDAELMALLDEEEVHQAKFTVTESTLHIPLVPETIDLEVEEDNEPEFQTWRAFTEPDEDWDEEAEKSTRTSTEPYIISADEYLADEMGYHQSTVTYYEVDQIMADMHDTPVYGWESLMGPLRWGHGSRDKNVVYIRNEQQRKEWEVLLHHGSFEIEVLGLQMEEEANELKHSLRKFRDD